MYGFIFDHLDLISEKESGTEDCGGRGGSGAEGIEDEDEGSESGGGLT